MYNNVQRQPVTRLWFFFWMGHVASSISQVIRGLEYKRSTKENNAERGGAAAASVP